MLYIINSRMNIRERVLFIDQVALIYSSRHIETLPRSLVRVWQESIFRIWA